ncbi:MAG: hypothetical protein LUC43_09720, partial [Burkholderiales bacterium]|nr:hypothetical protein [Burkholderiales bacterium]
NVIFVHGCFLHRHGCRIASVPKTNTEFWIRKFKRNKERDQENQKELQEMGWRVLIVWECSLKKKNLIDTRDRILDWMQSGESYGQISGPLDKGYLPVIYGAFESLIQGLDF